MRERLDRRQRSSLIEEITGVWDQPVQVAELATEWVGAERDVMVTRKKTPAVMGRE
jgi:hypothetical protein